jgi:amino acid adenylation domain-containing protein
MKQPRDSYTIGFPLDVCFWVTSPSDYNRLVPIGIPGELLVEGPHVGRGYLNDPDKTAKAFVRDPDFVTQLGISPGRRMYRTGDLVQQNTDGSLIHLGRIDTQIKIRGQRVETGEIESNIVRFQREVRIACVDLVRLSDTSGDPMLVAAIDIHEFGRDENDKEDSLQPSTVRRPTDALSALIRNLRAELLQVLPRYMVPQFVPMTSLPLNASSKLDRRATRAILAGLSRKDLGAFEKPTESAENRILSPMEDQLRCIWVEVLGCSPEIGAHDHFVQLGGDSVTAMRLVATAQRVDIQIGVADILQNPQLSDLARVAENYSATRATEQDPTPFELWNGFTDADAEKQKEWLSGIAEQCDVAPQDIEDIYPATALQEGLMAVTAKQPGAYVAQNVFRIRNIDMTRFKETWSKLMRSLAILRTRIVYHTAQSGSVQVVVRRALDWNQANDLQTYLAKDKALPFAYGTPLHRLAIVEPVGDAADQASYFVWTQHHSGYDGYQNALTLNILAQVYQNGGENYHPPPPVSRFIKYVQQADKERMATYWKQQLEDAHLTRFPALPHPLYHPLADNVSRRQVQRSRPHDGAPVAILLRAAWATTVATYTGNTEATSAVALSGRDVPVLDIGNAVVPTLTTVPVRTRLDDRTQLVSDLLAAMGRQSEEMKPFLHTGMQHIRAAVPGLGVDYDPGHLFIIQPSMGDGDEDPLLAIGLEELATGKTDFGGYALAVQCTINADRTVDVEMKYDSGVLPILMAEALLSQFEHTIQQLETHGDTAIGDLDLFKPADVERIRRWNQPVLHATPNRSCIHDLVQTVVDRQPHAQAVISWDGELSYAALSKAACRLAHHLVSLGVGPEVTVGVCMDKSLWAMVSMLAILQSGGVVVALGTQHPLSRIETIVADAGIRVTVVDKVQAKRLQGVPHPIVVDQSFVEQLPAHTTLPYTGVNPYNAAWIVYTSGSTGTPKGVVLEHQSLCTGIISHGTLFGNSAHTRAFQFASHTFGVVIEDMFTTLIFGGCTCIPSEDQRMNMSELPRTIRRMHVNFVNLTSTAASLIDPHDVPDIETVVLGGESVRPAVVELWAKHAKILNAYGQSECSVESVISLVEHERDAANIGFPIAGSAAWVVDPSDYNRLVPVGAPGELLIQGPLLSRGYLNDADKTAASFISEPGFLARLGLLPKRGSRMYCTGDLVQQNEDGSLVYLGRRDAQIKVRGQRVEPGEIESRIVQLYPEISHAFVDLVKPRDASVSAAPVLVAAVEFRKGVENRASDYNDKYRLPTAVRPPPQDLTAMIQRMRAALLQELPPYMVPSYFVPMSSHLPVNTSGKLDRRANRAILDSLSRDQLAAFSRVERGLDRALSATEEQLRAAYAEVLGCHAEDIGPDDHFIQLGGDSVAAMHVVAACHQRGMTVSVRDLLQRQSIAALSPFVVTTTEDDTSHDSNGVPEESSAVTDIQEWMLNYHVARPDVGMTYFALDATKPLIGERMADACRKLFTTIEALHTGFVVEDEKWKRVVPSTYIPDVQTYTTDATIDEWTEDYIQREGCKPLEPGRPLAEMAICTTRKQSGEHRVLFRISHAVWDGMCISKFWSALQDLYQNGQTKKVASFSQYVAQVEKRRTPEASRYWTDLLKDATIRPVGRTTPQDKDYVWRVEVKGPKMMELGQNLLKGTTYANVIKAAWALVLAQHTKCDDVVFADLVSGRAGVDPSVADAMSCCSTPMPVRIRLDPSSTYADLVRAVQKQQLDSIPFETFGFSRIAQQCTDWPAGTAATSWVNHVPKRVASKIEIGGTEYTISQPKQEEQNWTFSETRISWTHTDNSLEFTLAYAVEKVSEQIAQSLYDGLVSTLEQILTSPQALIGKYCQEA